ncbi:hypothetical protein [Acidovorax sp. SDU_ACID1]|jgi:hypothetical protein|uniref:hypothetical protein n=1 Tax=Acidovorax sp. SDU_ACID1 TaxID=3136632 RepID=UPI0038732CCE
MKKTPFLSSPALCPSAQEAGTPPGIILALSNVRPEVEADFNLWYEKEAIPARLALPGFTAARRYHAVGGNFSYMAFYRCASVEALFTEEYRQHMASPSEWRMQVRKGFSNLQWSVCRETWSAGSGLGGGAVIVQCSPIRGREQEVRRFLAEQLAPRILGQGGFVRLALWEADSDMTAAAAVSSTENLENYTNWILFMESSNLVGTAPGLHAELLSRDSSSTGLLIGAIMRYNLLSAYER